MISAGAQPFEVIGLLAAAGRGDDLEAELGQQRDRHRTDAAGRAGDHHRSIGGLEAVPFQRHHRQHRGVAGGADRHRLARRSSSAGSRTSHWPLTRAFSA